MKYFDDFLHDVNLLCAKFAIAAETMQQCDMTKKFGKLLEQNLRDFDPSLQQAMAVSSRGAH